MSRLGDRLGRVLPVVSRPEARSDGLADAARAAAPTRVAPRRADWNDGRHWFFAPVDPTTNDLLHGRLFQTRTTQLAIGFLRELATKDDLDEATILVDDAHHLTSALDRLGLAFQVTRHGDRTAVERVFREVKRRTASFSNAFSNAAVATAESWLLAFAGWHNRCQS